MESKADTRLVMISFFRAKAEFQRSEPQPLVGTSQRFPSKAMVTWVGEVRGRQGWACATRCGAMAAARSNLLGTCTPRAASASPTGQSQNWPSFFLGSYMLYGIRASAGLDTQITALYMLSADGTITKGCAPWHIPQACTPKAKPVP